MTRPPAPLSAAHAEAPREQLLAQLRTLETGDVLALCLRFHRSPERLALYLAVLRSRTGSRAQFSACLVCFDLARQGNETAQREFEALKATIRGLGEDQRLVRELLSGDRYLVPLWNECKEALSQDDPREQPQTFEEDVELVGEVDLFSEEEIPIDLELDPADEKRAEQLAEFSRVLLIHLGHEPSLGIFRRGYGFATQTSTDLDRYERFMQSVTSRSAFLPTARGLNCLGHLYLATHLRRRTLFGRPNRRRVSALRAGLAALPGNIEALSAAGAVFEFEGDEVAEGFQKVLELMLDFLSFCSEEKLDPYGTQCVDAYVKADRNPPAVLLSGHGKRRRW